MAGETGGVKVEPPALVVSFSPFDLQVILNKTINLPSIRTCVNLFWGVGMAVVPLMPGKLGKRRSRLKKSYLVASMFLCALVFLAGLPAIKGGNTGGEHLIENYDEIWVEYPVDIFYYSGSNEGMLKFPINVQIVSHSHWQWPYLWVASLVKLDIYIKDWTDNAPENVFDLWGYHVHCVRWGTDVSWSFTVGANIGFEGETIKAGAEVEAEWSFSSTAITSVTQTNGHWKTSSDYYHLGRVTVDLGDGPGHTEMRTYVTLWISVSNANAPNYKYNQYTFFLRVFVLYAAWWCGLSFGVKGYTHEFAYLGDGYPSTTDCVLYLLEASDYSYNPEP